MAGHSGLPCHHQLVIHGSLCQLSRPYFLRHRQHFLDIQEDHQLLHGLDTSPLIKETSTRP